LFKIIFPIIVLILSKLITNFFSLLLGKKNEIGRIPQKVGRWQISSDSEGFYKLFKATTLIETFPNYNQIILASKK